MSDSGKLCFKMSVFTDSILSLVSINLVVMATLLFQWLLRSVRLSLAVRLLSPLKRAIFS